MEKYSFMKKIWVKRDWRERERDKLEEILARRDFSVILMNVFDNRCDKIKNRVRPFFKVFEAQPCADRSQ